MSSWSVISLRVPPNILPGERHDPGSKKVATYGIEKWRPRSRADETSVVVHFVSAGQRRPHRAICIIHLIYYPYYSCSLWLIFMTLSVYLCVQRTKHKYVQSVNTIHTHHTVHNTNMRSLYVAFTYPHISAPSYVITWYMQPFWSTPSSILWFPP